MTDHVKSVFVDQEVAVQVVAIIKGAERACFLVSPYLKLWLHVKNAIEDAGRHGVSITAIVRPRDSSGGDRSENVRSEDVDWLLDHRVSVYEVPGLHAKVYLNEAEVLVSSMNLYEFSTNNALEFAMFVRHPNDAKQLRDYVAELQRTGTRAGAAPKTSAWGAPVSTKKEGASQPASRRKAVSGSCIRCARPVALDPAKPLCDLCYQSWAQWENVEYEENYCHVCGKEESVTYARPICDDCYRKPITATRT